MEEAARLLPVIERAIEPGMHLEDYLEGNWRPVEVIQIIDSYALGAGRNCDDFSPETAKKVIERSDLTLEQLRQLRTIAQFAYDALNCGTGPYAKVIKTRSPRESEKWHSLIKYLDSKLPASGL